MISQLLVAKSWEYRRPRCHFSRLKAMACLIQTLFICSQRSPFLIHSTLMAPFTPPPAPSPGSTMNTSQPRCLSDRLLSLEKPRACGKPFVTYLWGGWMAFSFDLFLATFPSHWMFPLHFREKPLSKLLGTMLNFTVVFGLTKWGHIWHMIINGGNCLRLMPLRKADNYGERCWIDTGYIYRHVVFSAGYLLSTLNKFQLHTHGHICVRNAGRFLFVNCAHSDCISGIRTSATIFLASDLFTTTIRRASSFAIKFGDWYKFDQ